MRYSGSETFNMSYVFRSQKNSYLKTFHDNRPYILVSLRHTFKTELALYASLIIKLIIIINGGMIVGRFMNKTRKRTRFFC